MEYQMDGELGTSELADLLGISRPQAIGLLERGLIPFRNVGVHRRVRVEDALKYKAEQRQRSLKAMAALQAENEALGLQ
jgi:excisionase family DNA binding protein